MVRRILLLLILCLGLPMVSAGGAASAQTTARPEVTALRFEGNEALRDSQLRASILTRQTECRSVFFKYVIPLCPLGAELAIDRAYYNARIFRSDYWRIHALYRSQGFRQIQLDTTLVRPTPTTVEITFHITEGEPVRLAQLEVEGVWDLDPELQAALMRDLPARIGDRLQIVALQAAADTLVRRLEEQGYPRAEVFRDLFIPAGTLEGEVVLDVFAGARARFGPMAIEGAEDVSEEVILRMLPFREGDVYDREKLFDGQRNLYGLELFRHAAVVPDLDHVPDTIVPLRIQVAEGQTRRVRTGVGWNTADCFTTEARWQGRNVLGGGRRLVLRGRVSNLLTSSLEDSLCSGAGTGEYARLNGVLAADFTQPWLFSPRNAFTTSVFLERQSVPDVYIRESLGASLALTRVVGRNTPVTVSWQPQLSRLDAVGVFFCTNFLVCDTDDIRILSSANRLSPLGIQAARDRTNRLLSPSSGYTAALELEWGGRQTLSDFDYGRALGQVTAFQPLPWDWVLASRIRGGWLGASSFRGLTAGPGAVAARVAPPQKRFYSGGANSVRGYAQNQLGPRVVTVGVEDLIFPRGDRLDPICAPEAVENLLCDVSLLGGDDVESRPTGGSAVLEGSVEVRIPLVEPYLSMAAFADFGQVWPGIEVASLSDIVVTPGIGVRYMTPLGPIRLDLAYRPPTRQAFPVVTSLIRPWREGEDPSSARIRDPLSGAQVDWVFEESLVRLVRAVEVAEPSGLSFRRFQLQFSIGQAF
jgi:outer membrane protein insertion porin family/translocation and assembly module TamA